MRDDDQMDPLSPRPPAGNALRDGSLYAAIVCAGMASALLWGWVSGLWDWFLSAVRP